MLHVTVLQVVAILIAFLAQFSRIFAATKPFWSKLPAVVQVWLPPILPFAAALQAQLAGVATWTDLVVALIVSAALLLPGAPSNRSAVPLQSGKSFTPPPMALLMFCCVLGLVLSSCTPADIAAERKAVAGAQDKLNQYCDARTKALEVLQSQDAGAAGAAP